MQYRATRNYENLTKAKFVGAGPFDMPILQRVDIVADQFIGFNFAKTCKDPENKVLHFFVDDYQFLRLWTSPDAYLPLLSKFKAVCTPDFSMYTDFPPAIQIYNAYRRHWLGAYWQYHGIKVLPTISWSDPASYEWCFDGEPIGSSVVISSVGTQADNECKQLFLLGYNEMIKRLKPNKIYLYGLIPKEINDDRIIRIPAYQEKHRTVRV